MLLPILLQKLFLENLNITDVFEGPCMYLLDPFPFLTSPPRAHYYSEVGVYLFHLWFNVSHHGYIFNMQYCFLIKKNLYKWHLSCKTLVPLNIVFVIVIFREFLYSYAYTQNCWVVGDVTLQCYRYLTTLRSIDTNLYSHQQSIRVHGSPQIQHHLGLRRLFIFAYKRVVT